jgi:uncharacterized protein (TIGR02453 family)
MSIDGFTAEAFGFYRGLVADNSRAYWAEHKAVYERAVRAPMQALLDGLSGEFDADVALFRPHRDVRFSADKSPYKTSQGGFLAAAPGVGYHLAISADGIVLGGGFHAHTRDQTRRYRAAVDDPEAAKRWPA